MSVLALASLDELESRWREVAAPPHRMLRHPETGLVMVRGRAGGWIVSGTSTIRPGREIASSTLRKMRWLSSVGSANPGSILTRLRGPS